ncbi:MAG: EAL domain-containing protein [Methylococcaceae bacterium]|nr:EAL domain-containing protein [Methylococcaceae bacterium]
MQWVSRIHEAIEKNRFVLYAQPIVPLGLEDGQGKHCEILTRMVSEEGQLILPGAFFPASERFNLSPRLDRWVVENTLNWLASNPERLSGLSMCSINLSGHSLGDEEFQNFVTELLGRLNIPPEKICFEITETAAISNLTRAIHFIRALKEQGCRFALDDFGSGLSSFAYLKNLPVDYLKIDGMFITDILDDPIDFAMVRSINEIGQLMGKKTIAEFVESDAIRHKLQQIGVNYIQGYAVGPPVPLDRIDESLHLH